MIRTINYDCNKLVTDLEFKEKSIVKGLKLIKIKKTKKTKCIRDNY